jgi:uncharacterized membrane protein
MAIFGSRFKRYFFTGLALIMPVVVTLYVLVALFRFVDNILGRFINLYLQDTLGFYIPGLGLILFFLIILLTGFLAVHFFGRNVFPAIERWFSRLPFIRQVYPSVKKIFNFVFSQDRPIFKKVVMIQYPRQGLYSLGFVVNEGLKQLQEVTGEEMVNVFIPSTPSPLTGYFVVVSKKDVIFLDLTIEDGLKMVVSGGVVNPESGIDKK